MESLHSAVVFSRNKWKALIKPKHQNNLCYENNLHDLLPTAYRAILRIWVKIRFKVIYLGPFWVSCGVYELLTFSNSNRLHFSSSKIKEPNNPMVLGSKTALLTVVQFFSEDKDYLINFLIGISCKYLCN